MEENNNRNSMSRVGASRPKRGDSSRTGSHRNRTSRVNPGNMARSPTYIDDVTLNAMITSGMMEALGPVHFAQFRVPIRQASDPNQNEIGPQIDYRLGWIPKNLNLSSLSNSEKAKEETSKFKSPEKDLLAEYLQDEEPPKKDPRFLLSKLTMEEGEHTDESIRTQRQDTIMQWFDKAVEQELLKRKTPAPVPKIPAFTEIKTTSKNLNYPQCIIDKMAEASASQIGITADMVMEPDTELTDAVEKLAKAEAMCAFAGAVKAAEAAAEAVPPEQAEEAALASARMFQSEINATEIREHLEGATPMEVIGYIGVTKPKNPLKSYKT